MLSENGHLLRIFIGEAAKHDGKPLYEWLVRKAKEMGLAGATVVRAIEGYGAHSQIHTAKILDLSTNLPIIIEIVAELPKVEDFLTAIDPVIEHGVATVEEVHIRFFRKHKATDK